MNDADRLMPGQELIRYLQGLNWTMLVIGTTFTIVLSVVSLLLYLNLDTAPRYRPQFDAAWSSVLLFAGVMLSAGAAAWLQRRRHFLRWPAEGVLVAAIVLTIQYFLPN